MKKLLLLLLIIGGFVSLNAQNPNDLIISGYVTNANGLAIANQQVCAFSDSLNPNPFNGCVYTNSNGFYTITVINGSIIGANQTYTVATLNCNNMHIVHLVQNNQGAVNDVTVNFTLCAASCVAHFTYQQNGLVVTFNSDSSSSPNSIVSYSWNFGDGSTPSTLANQTHTFANYGNYNVCLTIADNNGCSNTSCQTITITQQNTCGLSFTTTQNPNGVYHFVPTIAGAILNPTYLWNFGDGQTSTNHDPSHSYTTSGHYTVCLTVSGSGVTCTHCDSLYFSSVPPGCNANFTFQQSGLSVAFTSVAANIPVSYHWDFGNGTTSTLANPTITYANAGTYNVCLIVSGNYCADTICQSITAGTSTNCNVTFTYNTLNLLPNQVHFSGVLTPNAGTNIWHWDFGDGQTLAGGMDPYHQYNHPGYYSVCVYIGSNGIINCSYCDTVYVPAQTGCGVSFTYTSNASGTYSFLPTVATTITNPTYLWTFGDGQNSTNHDPSHTYANPGGYTVCLTVSSSGLAICTYCDSIYVTQNSCGVNFTYTTNGNGTFSFLPVLSNTITNPTFVWTFGDGSTATTHDPSHTYANYGNYIVCLSVTSAGSSSVCTYCDTINFVQSNPCGVSFTFSQTPNGAYHFIPTVASTLPNPQYLWNFGDGQTSTNHDPNHLYTTAGHYTVCLTISDSGATCTYCDSAYFSTPGACNANFSYQISGLNVTFSSVMPNSTASYYWNFGNGTTSTSVNPTVTYTTAGQYTVCLYVWTGSCSDTVCQTITVNNTTNCNVSFTYSSQNLLPNQVQFFGLLTPNSATTIWYWSFGDGQTVTGHQDPVHQYSQPGDYVVCVHIVQSNGNISCSYCDSVHVSSIPNIICNAHFTFQQSGSAVHFFANNSGISPSSTMHFLWDFGDGSTSSLIDPMHSYTSPGTYTVCLTVTDSVNNCTDQYCQNVIIGTNTTCQASFQYTYGSAFNVAFFGNFTPLSTYLQWHWSFGDSTFANDQNPIHNYAYPGTYQVCLTVVSPNCPAATYCQTITIQGNTATCQAYFTYQISNADVHFHAINSSSTPNQNMQYFWTFGDSTTGNHIDPIHTYTTMGSYNVCLTIIDTVNNCQDQFCQTITLGSNAQLEGQIFAGNNTADAGMVYLLSVTPNSPNSILPVASTAIQAGGHYQFSNIPYGQYLIQAHLDQASAYYFDYLPTYYGDVLYWSQANFIAIGQVNLTIPYDIHLIGTNLNNPGSGMIGGNVWLGNGNKSTVGGVLVVLLDQNNSPITYTYSDIDGNFKFTNLGWGSYKIYAEIWGKDPIPAIITLDANTPEADNVVITVNATTVISSISSDQSFYFDFVGNPYPNPASDKISLNLSLKQNASLAVNIYNIMGVSVYKQLRDYSTGTHQVNFNINNLPAGLYYIDIMADNKFRVSKIFNKIK